MEFPSSEAPHPLCARTTSSGAFSLLRNIGELFEKHPASFKEAKGPVLREASYMLEEEFEIRSAFDPFADAKDSDALGVKEYVHIRIQQRNGKKSVTIVEGLQRDFSYQKILKKLKKEFCCNGNVIQDQELGKIIQLQGDQRKKVADYLAQAGFVNKDWIKIHGY